MPGGGRQAHGGVSARVCWLWRFTEHTPVSGAPFWVGYGFSVFNSEEGESFYVLSAQVGTSSPGHFLRGAGAHCAGRGGGGGAPLHFGRLWGGWAWTRGSEPSILPSHTGHQQLWDQSPLAT